MQYQEANGITPTGVYDSVTMFMLEPFISKKYIRVAEIDRYADQIGVDRNILKLWLLRKPKLVVLRQVVDV